jgi:hypothetical protein
MTSNEGDLSVSHHFDSAAALADGRINPPYGFVVASKAGTSEDIALRLPSPSPTTTGGNRSGS